MTELGQNHRTNPVLPFQFVTCDTLLHAVDRFCLIWSLFALTCKSKVHVFRFLPCARQPLFTFAVRAAELSLPCVGMRAQSVR